MESMSGLSRMFINLESERLALDGTLILVLDPSTAPGGHDYQRVRAQLAARIPGIAVFTRRAIAAPLAAGHERWVTDPDFSIDRHLKHVGAPAPYDLSALCELTVSLLDEPLDRDRPLWQMFYVDGLADGSAALLFRMHHACIDGVGEWSCSTNCSPSNPWPRTRACRPAASMVNACPAGPRCWSARCRIRS